MTPPPTAVPPPNEWTSQFRRGVLELCILQVLRAEPNYGYEIVNALRNLGPLAAGENTVYPLLRRLKSDGYLETFAKESPAGPPRRYYRVTESGLARCSGLEEEWAALVRAVESCLVIQGVTP